MNIADWEAKVLAVPGTAKRVQEIEDELRGELVIAGGDIVKVKNNVLDFRYRVLSVYNDYAWIVDNTKNKIPISAKIDTLEKVKEEFEVGKIYNSPATPFSGDLEVLYVGPEYVFFRNTIKDQAYWDLVKRRNNYVEV